jgi:MscS family membrane protein
MNKKSLRNILLIITIFFISNAVIGAPPATSTKTPDKKLVKDAKTAAKDAKTAAKDAKVAAKDAKTAIEGAKEATQEAADVAKKAKDAFKDAKVINFSLFTTTNITKEDGKNKEAEVISIVQPENFKVESFADLILRIQKWWNGIIKWIGKQQLNILVLLGGIFLTLAIVMFVGWALSAIIRWRTKRHPKNEWTEKVFTSLKKPLSLLIFIIGVFLSSLRLLHELDQEFFGTVLRTFFALMAFSITWGVYRLVGVFDYYLQRISYRTDNNLDDLLVELIRKTIRFTVVFIAILFIGQTILGLRITALVAGAGIAGLAVALAAKDTLANFFGSVMIMLDRPFTVGERITVDAVTGNVERIGFRSTRIRSLDGHMFSIPNSKLADSVVENVAKRPFIKYAFDLTLVYNTTAVQIERAMKILHEIMGTKDIFDDEFPPRIYFTSFNDWALNISVIVWFQSTDYFETQKIKNDINLEILRRFNAEGLDFAFPTSTNHLVTDEVPELKARTIEETKK